MSPAAGRSFQPGIGLGLESLAFCTLPKPHNPKKSHPQLLDPKGSQKAQVENFLAPAITTWVIGPAVGGWPDPWRFPPPKSTPNTTLWALEEPLSSASVPRSLLPTGRALTPRVHTVCNQGSPQVSPATISVPVSRTQSLLQFLNSGLASINSLNLYIKKTHTHTTPG